MAETPPIRILVADDHDLIMSPFQHMAETSSVFEVVCEASTAEDAVWFCGKLQPDLVFMDIQIPQMGGHQAIRSIREQWPDIKVIVLSGYCEGEIVREALEAGANGYLVKSDFHRDHIVDVVVRAAAGEMVMSDSASRALAEETRRASERARIKNSLSARELQVLPLLVIGLNNVEIGEAIGVKTNTARNHVNSIINKLGARNRTEAATKAMKLGLI